LSGALSGIFPIVGLPAARARLNQARMARPVRNQQMARIAKMAPITATGVPPARIIS